MAIRDLKLRACLKALNGVESEVPSLATSEFQRVAEAYNRNVTRIHRLIMFPPASIMVAIRLQKATDDVHFKFPKAKGKDRSDLIEKRLALEYKKMDAVQEDERSRVFDTMEKTVFSVLDMLTDESPLGHEAWLGSQITGAWTAFEAMAGDLWEAALNHSPEKLAKLSGARQGKDGKQISLDYIQKYNFDLSKHMGTIFVDTNKYQFDRLSGIRDAYKDAFGTELNRVIDDPSLDALSIVRNNLVHSGGIIDAEYLRRSSVFPSGAMGKIGEPLPLDGELVVKLINPALKVGDALIVGVDNWLSSR